MPHAEIDGQRIRSEDTGGEGPSVVCSHGSLMDHGMSDPQVEAPRGALDFLAGLPD